MTTHMLLRSYEWRVIGVPCTFDDRDIWESTLCGINTSRSGAQHTYFYEGKHLITCQLCLRSLASHPELEVYKMLSGEDPW